jgi:hypothetical protein
MADVGALRRCIGNGFGDGPLHVLAHQFIARYDASDFGATQR